MNVDNNYLQHVHQDVFFEQFLEMMEQDENVNGNNSRSLTVNKPMKITPRILRVRNHLLSARFKNECFFISIILLLLNLFDNDLTMLENNFRVFENIVVRYDYCKRKLTLNDPTLSEKIGKREIRIVTNNMLKDGKGLRIFNLGYFLSC